MSFKNWLTKQLKRDDPIGDFARDALEVEPLHDMDRFKRLRELVEYLMFEGAIRDAQLAGVQAWREWKKGQRKRQTVRPRLRYFILARDGFRCRACGLTPAHGAVLHVDHIRSVAKGGATHPDNLQTLCETCNFGKGKR